MTPVKSIPIWDIWIRLFHWSLAIAVGFMLYTGLTGELFFDWHRGVGEFVLLLIVFRLVWGVIGSSNARLLPLFRSPVDGIKHVKHLAARKVPQERGHNAAGGWSVLAMLLILGIQAVTGMFIADEDEFVEGALYDSVSSDTSDLLYRIHKINAELIQVILIVHIVALLVYVAYAKRNLITPMFTGKILWTSEGEPPALRLQKWWVGLVILAPCAAGIGYLAGWY